MQFALVVLECHVEQESSQLQCPLVEPGALTCWFALLGCELKLSGQ